MANYRTLSIYAALKKTNKKAAKEYLEMADHRERINEAAEKVSAGIIDIKQDTE